jgi:hypothetical protein
MDHFISLATAADMTRRFRGNREAILEPSYQGLNLLSICETFDRYAFDQLLLQDGCTGIRIYYGMDENLEVHAVIVGVDAAGEDMVSSSTGASLVAEGDVILENGGRCPDICPGGSPLNT